MVKLWPWGDRLNPNHRPHMTLTIFWSAIQFLPFFKWLSSWCKTSFWFSVTAAFSWHCPFNCAFSTSFLQISLSSYLSPLFVFNSCPVTVLLKSCGQLTVIFVTLLPSHSYSFSLPPPIANPFLLFLYTFQAKNLPCCNKTWEEWF